MMGILCNGMSYRVHEFRPNETSSCIYKSPCYNIPLKADMDWQEARDAVQDVVSRIFQIEFYGKIMSGLA